LSDVFIDHRFSSFGKTRARKTADHFGQGMTWARHDIGLDRVTGQARPRQGIRAFSDPALCRARPIVSRDFAPRGTAQIAGLGVLN